MSSDGEIALRVEGLGKRYLVPRREAVLPTLAQRVRTHLKEYVSAFRGPEDEDYFWALRDVSFEVRQGEILGILGRNGSGKSTLLKILSGVTIPTLGRAELHGRIGSLLEVGTGFHPDLTGRENVFMNGALLGIRKREIRQKFDEIVDFAGIGQFIDVPVKRYSSGMYVRLAFSVASMLRSDILILDEVMSVGDQAFREKSQQKIERAASEGRSILFVSHNQRAISQMCRTGMVLEGGQTVYAGSAQDAVTHYLRRLHRFDDAVENEQQEVIDLGNAARFDEANTPILTSLAICSADGTPNRNFRTGESVVLRIGYEGAAEEGAYFGVMLMNSGAERVAMVNSSHSGERLKIPSRGVIECRIEDLRLGDGDYTVMLDYGLEVTPGIKYFSTDCVPCAATLRVSVAGYVKGLGITEFQGCVHRSRWNLA